VLKTRQLKQLLRKMAHLLSLAQRGGEILLVLLRRQRGGFQRQRFQIAQQRGQRRAEIVRNIGDKLPALAIAVGQPIPLRVILRASSIKVLRRIATSSFAARPAAVPPAV
jgi:pyruvate,water dikinase